MIREYDLTIARALNQVQMPTQAKFLSVLPGHGGGSLKVIAYGQAGVWIPREFTVLKSFEDFNPDELDMGFRISDWIGTVPIYDGTLVHVFMLGVW